MFSIYFLLNLLTFATYFSPFLVWQHISLSCHLCVQHIAGKSDLFLYWFRTEKNATPWSKERLKELFTNMKMNFEGGGELL